MALTYTPPGELGSNCPEFKLKGVDDKVYALGDFKNSSALVVMFICNHCPYVKAIEDRMLKLARDLSARGAQFVAICSNDPTEYPEDSFEQLAKRWREKNYGFPYLHDAKQDVAKKFGAVCTPDIFVYDTGRRLAYRGRFDDSWKDASKVSREDLRLAIEDILKRSKVHFEQVPSMGCSIKWSES